jgi:hypothetical protein
MNWFDALVDNVVALLHHPDCSLARGWSPEK